MSKMESKKLLTAYSEEDGLWNPGGVPWDEAVDHDACIAHDQLEVIDKLVRALQLCQPTHPYEKEGFMARSEALGAAAPYIQD